MGILIFPCLCVYVCLLLFRISVGKRSDIIYNSYFEKLDSFFFLSIYGFFFSFFLFCLFGKRIFLIIKG